MTKKKPRPNPVDRHVGEKLKQLRTMKGFTQEKLAQSVGITFQQVQKYERGTNRIGASRLYDFSHVLRVPVSSFFEGAMDALSNLGVSLSVAEREPETFQNDPFKNKEALELLRAYYKIQDPKVRRKVIEMTKLMAETGGQS